MNECQHCGDRWTGDHEHVCLESPGEKMFQLTPKGILIAAAQSEGLTIAAAERLWDRLESFCVKQSDEDSHYAALIFDGEGGVVMGAEKV